jgi:hypothetical protein
MELAGIFIIMIGFSFALGFMLGTFFVIHFIEYLKEKRKKSKLIILIFGESFYE